MGVALPGGAIEYFANTYRPDVTLDPTSIVQHCIDQGAVTQGIANTAAYMAAMNTSYNGLGRFGAAQMEMWCANFPPLVRAANPFAGFNHVQSVQTAGQILFIANTMDGRHSLANAQAMSALFSNSGILLLNEMGVSWSSLF